MNIPDSIDSVVNFIPNKCIDLAFKVVNEPEGFNLACVNPIGYTIGLSAEAAAIGYAAGRFSNNGYVGIGAAAAIVVASLTVKTVSVFRR